MNTQKQQDQGINALSQIDYLPILISSFLVDRKAQGFAAETVEFYRKKLKYFEDFCEGQAVTSGEQRQVLGADPRARPDPEIVVKLMIGPESQPAC